MKICSECGIEKPLVEFYKEKSGKFGVRANCKCCVAEHNANPENIAKQVEYYQVNREEILAKQAEYKAKPENIAKRVEYQKERKLIDPLFKLSGNIRTLIGNSIKRNGFKKSSKTAQILGCTFEEFKEHIESQFQEGMTWDNQGLWHFDHIYPVSLAENEEHLIQLNHYTNFQPLWAEDNIRKGNKII